MGSRLDFISPEGLRLDGRRPREGRKIECRLGVLPHADGSALMSQGNTKVIVAVFGPRPSRAGNTEEGALVRCDVSFAAFSGSTRRRARRDDQRSLHVAQLVKSALQQTISHKTLGHTQIDIQIQFLGLDGGVFATAINGASLALVSAGIPVYDFLAASSLVCIDNTSLLDPNSQELSCMPPEFLVATHPNLGKVVVMEQEGGSVAESMFTEMAELGIMGAAAVSECMSQAVLAHNKRLAHAHA